MKIVRKSFTLIEMLIVIVIIGILAAALVPRLQSVQARARDSKRKVDLRSLNNVFEMYRIDNGDYPTSQNALVSNCLFAVNCGVGSFQNNGASGTKGQWISGLVNMYVASLPTDPINNALLPFTTGAYGYYYANVFKYASGQTRTYDLFTRLENKSDPERCAVNTGSTTYSIGNLICVDTINSGWGDLGMIINYAPRRNP